MNKLFLASLLLFSLTPAAKADLTHKLSSSVQLTVNAAATQVERIGSSYSVSGNGLDSTYNDGSSDISNGIGSMAISSGVGTPTATSFTQDVPGAAFSFSQSYTAGDALVTTAASVGAVSPLSSQVSTAAGVAGSLAGTITTAGAMTVTGGGAGTVGTGQFVSELHVN
tara:strand:+ start:1743 stop:2246 length:504 start_codon:yes stop_codon:yes gene_type:complete